jgi:hypothetical protein
LPVLFLSKDVRVAPSLQTEHDILLYSVWTCCLMSQTLLWTTVQPLARLTLRTIPGGPQVHITVQRTERLVSFPRRPTTELWPYQPQFTRISHCVRQHIPRTTPTWRQLRGKSRSASRTNEPNIRSDNFPIFGRFPKGKSPNKMGYASKTRTSERQCDSDRQDMNLAVPAPLTCANVHTKGTLTVTLQSTALVWPIHVTTHQALHIHINMQLTLVTSTCFDRLQS